MKHVQAKSKSRLKKTGKNQPAEQGGQEPTPDEVARWQEENREAIDSYNKMIAERGPFSDDMKLF